MTEEDSLNPRQKSVLDDLAREIYEFCRKHDQIEKESGSRCKDAPEPGRLNGFTREEMYGTFGLFGSRGTGKTTLVELLERKLCERDEKHPIHVCWPPLDCTALPSDVPFGVSLTNYLADRLAEATESPQPCGRDAEGSTASIHSLLREQLMPEFLPLDPQYRKLKLSLAVTSSEYQNIAQKELTARQSIQGKVRKAVCELLPRLEKKKVDRPVRYLLVILEDADLSVGRLNANLLSSFLTDFSFSKLLFLVVADEEHLELRIASEGFRSNASGSRRGDDRNRDAIVSKRTVLRMLDKLIPVGHRFYLSAWPSDSAWSFRPLGAPEDADRLGDLLKKALGFLGEHGSESLELKLRAEDLVLLLPPNPRGLNDFYKELRSYVEIMTRAEQAGESLARLTARDLLVRLAHCRGEHGLARKLNARPVDWRAARLSWEPPESEQPSWYRIQHEALSGSPVWALGSREGLVPGVDPGSDDALWVELILNYSFRTGYSNRRVLFLERFAPLRRRIRQCQATFQLTPHQLGVLRNRPGSNPLSPWLTFSRSESGSDEQTQVRAGWANLLLADLDAVLRESRSVIDLLVPEYVGRVQAQHISKIAPRDVRSLVLLVDEISALPWLTLQEWAERDDHWYKITWILDLLCAGAYARAFEKALTLDGRIKREGDSAEHGDLERSPKIELTTPQLDLDHLEEYSESALKGLVTKMRNSRRHAIPDHHRNHPMAEALIAFFETVVSR